MTPSKEVSLNVRSTFSDLNQAQGVQRSLYTRGAQSVDQTATDRGLATVE